MMLGTKLSQEVPPPLLPVFRSPLIIYPSTKR